MKRKIDRAVNKINHYGALWAPYGHPSDGYEVSFGWEYDQYGDKHYYASLHKDAMPSFQFEVFDTAEKLAAYVLELQPDLRRWHAVPDILR